MKRTYTRKPHIITVPPLALVELAHLHREAAEAKQRESDIRAIIDGLPSVGRATVTDYLVALNAIRRIVKP